MKKIIFILTIVIITGGLYAIYTYKACCDIENQILQTNQDITLTQVSNYIKQNISNLSPQKEALGGKFFVISTNFKENVGITNYEDGHNAYTATFVYSTSTGKVEISNFKLLSNPLNYNFEKQGNLTRPASPKAAGMWFLVYEEPGKPGLDAELKFGDDSLCTSGQETMYCSSFVFTEGDRVKVIGNLDRTKRSIDVMRFTKL